METSRTIILILWFFFIIFWAVSAINVKKDIKRKRPLINHYVSVLIIIGVIILSHLSKLNTDFIPDTLATEVFSVVFCVSGVGLAIWARIHLGKNWSPKPAIKESHELVTSGPYEIVRHPIYTGILMAIFGTALVGSGIWFIAFLAICINFIYRLKIEEEYMVRLFGDKYLEYKNRTKALVPFVW